MAESQNKVPHYAMTGRAERLLNFLILLNKSVNMGGKAKCD